MKTFQEKKETAVCRHICMELQNKCKQYCKRMGNNGIQDRKFTCKETLRRVRGTIVVEEKQYPELVFVNVSVNIYIYIYTYIYIKYIYIYNIYIYVFLL